MFGQATGTVFALFATFGWGLGMYWLGATPGDQMAASFLIGLAGGVGVAYLGIRAR
jgi:hypothetical protein